jgi:Tol biopolymer transport system component
LKIKVIVFSLLCMVSVVLYGCNHTPDVTNINGVEVLKISEERGAYSYPVWSPDGNYIAFQITGGDFWLFSMDRYSLKKLKDRLEGASHQMIWDKGKEINYLDSNPNKHFATNAMIRSIDIDYQRRYRIVR